MTALLPARRRAEAFADAVDALPTGGRTTRPDGSDDARFVGLLEVVSDLVAAGGAAVEPRASFAIDLRARLMLAAETDLIPTDERLHLPPTDRHGERRRRSRWATAATTAAVVAGTAGVAVASSHSVPGEPLHPVKLGVEHVRSALSFGDAAQGRTMLASANARLDEITRMLGGAGDRSRLPDTIDAFTAEASQGTRLLFRAYNADGATSSVTSVTEFVHSAMARLASIADDAPSSTDPMLDHAAQALSDADQEARVLCVVCDTGARLQTPGALGPVSGPASGSSSVLIDPATVGTQANRAARSGATSDNGSATTTADSDTGGQAPPASGSVGNGQMTEMLLGIIVDGTQPATSSRTGDKTTKDLTRSHTSSRNHVGSTVRKGADEVRRGADGVGKNLRDTTGGVTGSLPLGDIFGSNDSAG